MQRSNMQRSNEHQLQDRVEALEAEVKDLRTMITHMLQVVPEAISPTSTLRAGAISPTSTIKQEPAVETPRIATAFAHAQSSGMILADGLSSSPSRH
ncbi:unnamed protein product [Zymoseptoria tritici ST99CH_1A5]|uniref:Uncharacterized protein n=2 Tax=Zymoseptoria tritici TaxID=1047171 RepID=A0A2H1H9V5_ZYMTR|nr:unnamed protein product [Zymoseptoria tritici ST99CH_1E4]SMY30508.1 unnamed protein product [Zymoseptoria tritici ST99CH_1A5]